MTSNGQRKSSSSPAGRTLAWLPVLAAAGLLAGAMAGTPAPASAAGSAVDGPPPAGAVKVRVVDEDGAGCRTGTVEVALAMDKKTFTVSYTSLIAQAGRDASPADFRSRCQVAVQLTVPPDTSYAVTRADYRGFADLNAGTSATVRSNVAFRDQTPPAARDHAFQSPMSSIWQVTDTIEPGARVYSPCGDRPHLILSNELRVRAGSSDPRTTSFISMDNAEGNTGARFHLAWQRCD